MHQGNLWLEVRENFLRLMRCCRKLAGGCDISTQNGMRNRVGKRCCNGRVGLMLFGTGHGLEGLLGPPLTLCCYAALVLSSCNTHPLASSNPEFTSVSCSDVTVLAARGRSGEASLWVWERNLCSSRAPS